MNGTLTPQEAAALKKEILSSLHCAMPGTVVSFDQSAQTASVRPALKNSSLALPVIQDVPVFFPGGRECGITWPVAEGDECLLVFADFDIDRWFSSGEAEEPASGRRHDLPDAFAFVGFRSRPNALGDFPDSPRFFDGSVARHDHDDRYFTETEVTDLLSGKSDTGHNHDDRYFTETEVTELLAGKSNTGHTHDGRYFTETEVTEKLSGKSDTGHKHAAGDITSGTLALGRGGTGQTATGATTTIDNIASAASGCEITTAQYAYWGKTAMVRLVIKKTEAVSSGTTTLCTLVSGKRPKYIAGGVWAWNKTAQITTAGNVQVNGAISANASLTIYATYVLA